MTKSSWIKIRVDDREKRGFEEAAEITGLSVSAWMRERLRRAASQELREAQRPVPFLTFDKQ